VDLALLDSSALVAYMIGGDSLHVAAVDAIESAMTAGRAPAISVVTWSELLHGALLGYCPEDAVRELVADFGIAILPVDLEVAEHAAALQAAYAASGRRGDRPRLRTPDALVLGTSLVHGATTVICGDEIWANVPGVNARIVMLREQS
jgi:predicted nucleic acid-binding protein